MSGTSLLRRILTVGCVALALSLLAVPASFAAPAPWTKIAANGVTDPNNKVLLPGVLIKGKLTVGAGSVFGGAKATMYTYDTAFHQLGQPGFGSNNTRLMPWALYGGEVYIGTENATSGGELWKWGGSGNPVLVRNNGWGLGNGYSQVNPIAVYNGKLLVCVGKSSFSSTAFPGLRLYQYDGNAWTQVIGQGAAGTSTGPGFGNAANENVTATEYSELNGNLVFCVSNPTDGLQVYSYNGSSFTRIGHPGAGSWPVAEQAGQVATSQIENKLYVGTGSFSGSGVAELWSYDGSHWAKIALSGGLQSANNFFFQPFIRGADLYVSAWNLTDGCRIYKRQGNAFATFSTNGFGNSNNLAAMLATYNGKMFGQTFNGAGAEVDTTPIAPSIDRLVPNSGPHGTVVTIQGHDLGVAQGNSTVTFKGVEAKVLSWSDLSIQAVFPDEATTGPVQVRSGRGNSNPVIFTVAPSAFYFAEGTTRANFQEYLCLGNSGAQAASAQVTFLFTDGTTKDASYTVPANSRLTVDVNNVVGPNKDLSLEVQSESPNLVAERPMYFNYNGVWTGGSDAIGAVAPNNNWYFAEGNTLKEFDQYVTVLNPGSTKANLTFRYMVEGQGEKDVTGSVGAHSRATFKTRDQIGDGKNVSLSLESNQPVVAERPMYFNYLGLAANNWTGGHDVVGTNSPNTNWYFAEGTTRKNSVDGAFEQWLCLQNPGTTPLTVSATYQLATGQGNPISKSYTVPAEERLTVSVNREIGQDKDCSVYLHSTSDFIAERPMYFSYHPSAWTGGHDVLGTNSSATSWYFAEGTTRANFEEWLCLQNPGNSDAHTTINYYTTSGQVITKSWTVKANTRLTVSANTDVGANQDISAKVSSDKPIIVERPMYFNFQGVWTGGHDVVGFVPQ